MKNALESVWRAFCLFWPSAFGDEKAKGEKSTDSKSTKDFNNVVDGEEDDTGDSTEGENKDKKKAGGDDNENDCFFNCRVCSKTARDPILTYCGHIYCWPCFHTLPSEDVKSTIKQCFVCKVQVWESTVIPIRGMENRSNNLGDVDGGAIPPRPWIPELQLYSQTRMFAESGFNSRSRLLDAPPNPGVLRHYDGMPVRPLSPEWCNDI